MDNNINTNTNANTGINLTIFDFIGNQTEPTYLQVGDKTIELRRPTTAELVDIIQGTLEAIITDQPFISAPIQDIFVDLGLVSAFTNIEVNFTGRSVAEIYAAYDALLSYDLFHEILLKADKNLTDFYLHGVHSTLDSIIQYKRSAQGILDAITAQAKADTSVMEEAEKIMTDPQQIENVKNLLDVYNKMSTIPETVDIP